MTHKKILDNISRSIGLSIRAYCKDGFLVYGEGEKKLKSDIKYGTKVVAYNGVTYFGLGDYIGVIDGDSETISNYAIIISNMAAGSYDHMTRPNTVEEQIRHIASGKEGADKIPDKGLGGSYFVLGIVVDKSNKSKELASLLGEVGESGDIVVRRSEDTIIYLKSVGQDVDYISAGQFGRTLYDNLNNETNTKFGIGVGGVAHSIDTLRTSTGEAIEAIRFGRIVDPGAHVYSYKEFALHKLLDSLPKETLKEYLRQLATDNFSELIGDEELMRTAEAFLKNSLNISETARAMYLHRNTLIYRLDKVENITGLNIRNFGDAVVFWVVGAISKIVG